MLATLFFTLEANSRILDFHGEIRVAKSGELTVTERITLEAKDAASGLERRLPPESRVIDVIRNGSPEPYAMDGNWLRTAAQSSRGRHLYQLTYRSERQVLFLDGYDELRWNAGGAERLTAEVILPGAVPARGIKAEATGRDWQSFVRDGRAAFRAKENLEIRVRFPKEVVAAPPLGERARWFVADHLGLLVLAGLCLAAGALVKIRR